MRLHITNLQEYYDEVHHLIHPGYPMEVLQKLYNSIYYEGAQERIIIFHMGRFVMFEFLHEMGYQVYYTFEVQVKARRWELIDEN